MSNAELYTLEPEIITEQDAVASIGDFSLAPSPKITSNNKKGLAQEVFEGSPAVLAVARATSMFYDMGEADPNYDGFSRWEELGVDEKYLDDFLDAENDLQASLIEERILDTRERESVIDDYGLTGEIARFVGDVALDPTVYATFGAAGMLRVGMSAKAAYAVSGAAGGATYAAIDAFGSPEEASAAKALGYTAAGAVFGGLIGTGVDTYARLKTKKIVNKSFQDMSGEAMTSVSLSSTRSTPESLSAAIPEGMFHDYSVGGNFLARGLAKSMRLASPRLYFQTSNLEASKQLGAKLLGYNTRTKTQMEEGLSGVSINVSEETQYIRDSLAKDIIEFGNDELLKKTKITPDDEYQAALAFFSDNFDIDSLTPVQRKIYDFNKKFYDKTRKIMEDENVPSFEGRDDYGFPLIISAEKAAQNIDDLTMRIETRLLNQQKFAKADNDLLQSKINGAKTKLLKATDEKEIKRLNKKIEDIEDLIEQNNRIIRASAEELQEDARISASRMATGDFVNDIRLNSNEKVNKSRFFNQRQIDPLEFLDYIETNPVNLAMHYTDSVAPHIAFNRAFPEYTNVDELINDYKKVATEEAAQKGLSQKAKKEIEGVINRAEKFWNLETGMLNLQAVKNMGEMAPVVQMMNDTMYMTQMGGQTIAAIMEPINIMLHHGILKGGAGLAKTLKSIATDAEFRKISEKEAKYLGVGLEVGNNSILKERLGFEVTDKELSTTMSKLFRKGSLAMGKANLSVYFDQSMRKAISIAQEGVLADNLTRYSVLNKTLKGDLAFLGIDKSNVSKIVDQLNKYGKETELGNFLANASLWDDQSAADIWRRAIRKDLRRTSVMSDSGDVPFVFRTPLGSLFFKYKTWAVAATSKLTIQALQQPSKTWPSVVSLIGTGALIQMLLDKSQGKEVQTDIDELVWAGINRSGVSGVLPEVGGSMLMNKLFNVQSGGGKVYEYMKPSGIVAGPTGNFLDDLGVIGTAIPEKQDDGSYEFDFYDKNGNIKQGVINSSIDLLPLPLVKPWLKSAAQGNYE